MNQQAFFAVRRGASAAVPANPPSSTTPPPAPKTGKPGLGLIVLPQGGTAITASQAAMGERPPSIEALKKLKPDVAAYWWSVVCNETEVKPFLATTVKIGEAIAYIYELEAKIQIEQAKKVLIESWGKAFAGPKQLDGLAQARAALDAGCAGLAQKVKDNWLALDLWKIYGKHGTEMGPGAPYAGALAGWTKQGGIESVTAAPNPNDPSVRAQQVVVLSSDLFRSTVSGPVAIQDFITFWGGGNATTKAVLTALFGQGGVLFQKLSDKGAETRPLWPEVKKYVQNQIVGPLNANGAFYKFGSKLAFAEAQASLKQSGLMIELWQKGIAEQGKLAEDLTSQSKALLMAIQNPLSKAVAMAQGELNIALGKQAGQAAAAQMLIDAGAAQAAKAGEVAKLVESLIAKNTVEGDAGGLAGAAFAAGARAAGNARNSAAKERTDESGRLLGQIEQWATDNPAPVPGLKQRQEQQGSQQGQIAETAEKIIKIGGDLSKSLKFLGGSFDGENANKVITANTEEASTTKVLTPPPPKQEPEKSNLPLLLLLGAVALSQLGGAK